MTRRRVLRLFTRGLIGLSAGELGSRLARAADSAQRVARLGQVAPESASTVPPAVSVFWERLHELGWIEGQNLVVERRWAEGHLDRLPALMADVVGHNVDVILTGS